jgi:ATP-binding cassette subfamily C protein
LEVSKGKQVAIIGPSGAGKTTLLNLILGLIQPDIGEIAISGKSPKDAFRTWPGAVSYVPQNIYVFAGSLEANLRIGLTSENIKEIDMIRVLKTAELDKFLQDHEKTLDFQVESGGTNLSGGEKQRVAIARALLTSPKLLVLDEVTSSLDYNTEANFTQTLKELKGKITVLIVAHRLSTVKNADLIIYLDKGKIRAIGNLEDIKKVIPNFEIAANLSNK